MGATRTVEAEPATPPRGRRWLSSCFPARQDASLSTAYITQNGVNPRGVSYSMRGAQKAEGPPSVTSTALVAATGGVGGGGWAGARPDLPCKPPPTHRTGKGLVPTVLVTPTPLGAAVVGDISGGWPRLEDSRQRQGWVVATNRTGRYLGYQYPVTGYVVTAVRLGDRHGGGRAVKNLLTGTVAASASAAAAREVQRTLRNAYITRYVCIDHTVETADGKRAAVLHANWWLCGHAQDVDSHGNVKVRVDHIRARSTDGGLGACQLPKAAGRTVQVAAVLLRLVTDAEYTVLRERTSSLGQTPVE
jgi:hypothetical protein